MWHEVAPRQPASAGLEIDLIDVAPDPVLVRLERLDDGVATRMDVRRRVLVGGDIAATHMTAAQAQPQVDPPATDLEAVLATVGGRRDILDLVEMGARDRVVHHGKRTREAPAW